MSSTIKTYELIYIYIYNVQRKQEIIIHSIYPKKTKKRRKRKPSLFLLK